MAPSPARTASGEAPEPTFEADPKKEGAEPRPGLVVYNPERGPHTMPQTESERRTLAYGNEGETDKAATDADPAPAGAEPERRRIGDFLVRRLIGEGGMGKVYEAEERLSRRRVALKVLRSELSRSEAGRRQFVNEMGILASLDDPYIVRCLHCTEVEGELVMALEYLEGRTLRERMLEVGAMAWDEVVAVAWQIASALDAAHGGESPIIHRDLKPENVMLVGGRVKVMDFGIAKVVQAVAGNTTHSVGTLQYMSPEQIDARPLSPRSDLYALGLLMWEMLAGRPPFEAESPRVLLDKLCTEPAPALPSEARRGLPRGVEQLVFDLLEKAPEDRPANAAEVIARLEPFRPAELDLGGKTSPGTSPGRPSKQVDLATEPADRASTSPASSTADLASDPASDLASDLASKRREPSPAGRSPSLSSEAKLVEPANAKRYDTVAVVERAAAPREIPTKLAVSIIASLSLAAGLITYLIRLLAS